MQPLQESDFRSCSLVGHSWLCTPCSLLQESEQQLLAGPLTVLACTLQAGRQHRQPWRPWPQRRHSQQEELQQRCRQHHRAARWCPAAP